VKRQAVRDGLHIIAAAMLMEAGERNLKKMWMLPLTGVIA
jgi:hypothetical protein